MKKTNYIKEFINSGYSDAVVFASARNVGKISVRV